MAANVRITVDLDANQATQVAGKLSQVLAEASINGAQVQVGSPEQVKATSDQAAQLNQIVKQILISTERLNIALAKTAKLTFELNRGKGALSPNKKAAYAQFDNIIASSEAAIKQIQNNFVPAVQSVQPAAQKTATETKKVGDAAQKAATTGRGAFKGFTSEMKTSMTTAQALAKSFFSPITIAIIAFEAVVKTFTYFWDNLTESIQKMTTRAQTAIKAIQRKQKAVEQETKASKDLIKQLEELNKQQNLSIDQQRLAEAIIAKLNKQYKDLGITLDETTGKYTNLYEAQRKIDERNRRSQANALQKEITAQRDIVNAALANAFGRGISLDKMVKGSDFFGVAEELGNTLGAQNAQILAKKWNTGDLQKQLEVIDQLIQGLSSSDQVLKNGPEARQALATLIDYRKQLQELNSVDTQIVDMNRRIAESFKQQADALKETKEQIESLTKTFEEQQRANSLAQLDPEDRANALRGEVEQLEKRNQVLQEAKELGKEELNQHTVATIADPIKLENLQKDMKQVEQEAKKLKEQIDELHVRRAKDQSTLNTEHWKNAKYIEAQRDLETIKKSQAKIQKQLVEKQKKLAELQEETRNFELEYQKNQQTTLKYQQALATLEKKRQQNLNAIQEKTQQIAELEEQIEAARRQAEEEAKKAAQAEADRLQKQAESIDAIYSSYQKQLESYNKTDLETKIQDALQNAQKAKGDVLTREEIDQIIFYVTQLEKMNELEKQRQQIKRQQDTLEGIFTNYEQQQVLEYMKLNDMRKEALLLEAKLNAEKALGRKLTEDELKSLQQYIDRQMMLEDASKTDQKRVGVKKYSDSVISNDLASKGGFASSIVVDRSVEINEQILQVQKSQKDLLSKMSNSIEKYSVIQ